MKAFKTIAGTLALAALALGCENENGVQTSKQLEDSPVYISLPAHLANGRTSTNSRYTLLSGEYLTTQESGRIGRTVYFKNVGNKELTADFVPGTSLDGSDNISYYIDENRPSDDLKVSVTSPALARAMTTWDAVSCSSLGMYRIPTSRKISTGFVSSIYGYRGSTDYVADVVHSGWLPGSFFDLLAEDGSDFILAVTFTIVFTDDAGNATDVDKNGKADVAWREIYYNDAFAWADGAHYDVETIALHEAGHGLSQGHFGTAFVDSGTNALHFSPRAVMNAAYSGIQTDIAETDNAGHCTNWAEWSNN